MTADGKLTPLHVAALLIAMLEGAIEEGSFPLLIDRSVDVDLHDLSEIELLRREREEGPVYLVIESDDGPTIEVRIDYEQASDRPPRTMPSRRWGDREQ